ETRPPRDLTRVVVPHGLTTVHTLRRLTLPQLGLLLHLCLQGLQHPRPIFLFHFSLQLHESRRPRSQQWWLRPCGGWPRFPCSRCAHSLAARQSARTIASSHLINQTGHSVQLDLLGLAALYPIGNASTAMLPRHVPLH